MHIHLFLMPPPRTKEVNMPLATFRYRATVYKNAQILKKGCIYRKVYFSVNSPKF